jgi:hypothetical protein
VKKLSKRTVEDQLFERTPPAIQEAQRRVQHEQRMRKRAEWKAKQEQKANDPTAFHRN